MLMTGKEEEALNEEKKGEREEKNMQGGQEGKERRYHTKLTVMKYYDDS